MSRRAFLEAPRRASVGGVTKQELLERLARASVRLNLRAEDLFADERFETAERRRDVSVQVVSVRELGFASGAKFSELSHAAALSGLALCPLELAPHLRLQFAYLGASNETAGQSKGRAPIGSVTVASVPPGDEELLPWGFYLLNAGTERWLRGYSSWSGHVWGTADTFAFIQAENAA